MTLIPTGIGQWLHVESGARVTDDGQTTLTLTYGANIVTIPAQHQTTARRILGIPVREPDVTIPDATLKSIGLEKWTAGRNMP